MTNISSQLRAYLDVGIKEVEGWGIDEDLVKLFVKFHEFQTLHSIRGSLCEIGVHHGKTLILLALLARDGERVVGIDLFEQLQAENLDASGLGSLEKTRRNLSLHAGNVPVQCITGSSFDLSPSSLAALSDARIFHIDGGHFLEVVLNDLQIAQNALASGGIIVVDDFWHSLFPEVHEAVCRYFSTATVLKAVPFMTGRNKVFLAHLSHRDRLVDFMRSALPAERTRRVKLFGYDSICCDLYA